MKPAKFILSFIHAHHHDFNHLSSITKHCLQHNVVDSGNTSGWLVSLLPKTLTILQTSAVEKMISQPDLLPLASDVFCQSALKPDAAPVWRFWGTWAHARGRGGRFSLAADQRDLTIRKSRPCSASVMHYERESKKVLWLTEREEGQRKESVVWEFRNISAIKTQRVSDGGVVDAIRQNLISFIWFWS